MTEEEKRLHFLGLFFLLLSAGLIFTEAVGTDGLSETDDMRQGHKAGGYPAVMDGAVRRNSGQ